MTEVNLKKGMPNLDEARRRLSDAIASSKRGGLSVIKLIHGYGSSGVGGALQKGIRASLRKRRKKGEIRGYIPGENWSIFDEASRDLLDGQPALRRDGDLDRHNEGITLVLL